MRDKGIIHMVAECSDCSWIAPSKFPNLAGMRKDCRKHTKETGHSTWLEYGSHEDFVK